MHSRRLEGGLHKTGGPDFGLTDLPTHFRPLAIDRPTASMKSDASERAFIIVITKNPLECDLSPSAVQVRISLKLNS